jgi:predicted RNA-binding Zn ribbon-like protein
MVIVSERDPLEPAELIEAFCNTRKLEEGVDVLDAGWLVDHGLLPAGSRLGAEELARARAVREALRQLALANNGHGTAAAEAGRVVDRQARRSGLAVRFTPYAEVKPATHGADGALGRVLAATAAAMGDGTWRRLKACHAETCRWVYYDRSRNESRRWCSMEICGNRSKARSYRVRRAK